MGGIEITLYQGFMSQIVATFTIGLIYIIVQYSYNGIVLCTYNTTFLPERGGYALYSSVVHIIVEIIGDPSMQV